MKCDTYDYILGGLLGITLVLCMVALIELIVKIHHA